MTTATIIKAEGTFKGQKAAAEWHADSGFQPTGNPAFDFALFTTAVSGVSIGGTYFPKQGAPDWAAAVFSETFDGAPEITANGEIPPLPYEAGEDAIY